MMVFTRRRYFALLLIFLVIYLSVGGAHVAQAATYTWDGGGGDALWSNDLNWSSDVEPGTSDIAYFDGTCVTNCSPTIGANVSVAGINMAAGYTGTITMSGGSAVTVGTSHFTQAAGTFVGGTGTTTIQGNFTISGGTYNAASTTSLAGTNHTIDVTTTQTFASLTFASNNGTWVLSSGDTLIVTGTTTFSNGYVNGPGTLDMRGNIVTQSTSDGGTAVVDFGNDSLAQTWTVNGGTGPVVRFNSAADASDSIVFTANSTFSGATTTSAFTGTIPITLSGYELTIGNSGWQQAAGTFSGGAGTTTIQGNFTLSGGTYNAASTTHFGSHADYGGKTVNVMTSQTFDSVKFTGGGYVDWGWIIASGDTLVVTGTTTFNNLWVNGGTIDARGNVVTNSTATGGTATVDFGNDSLAQTWTVNGGVTPAVRFNSAADASDAVSLSATSSFYGISITSLFSGAIPLNLNGYPLTVGAGGWTQATSTYVCAPGMTTTIGGNFTLSDGTFSGGAGTTTIQGNFTLSGGTYNAANTTHFGSHADYGGKTVNVMTSQTFDSVKFTGGGYSDWGWRIASGDTLVVTGTTTFDYLWVDGGTIDARGDVKVNSGFGSGFTQAPSLVMLTGSSTSGKSEQVFDLTSATGNLNSDITVNKSEGKVSLLSALVMDAANQDMLIQSGKLDLNGNNLTVSGSGKTFIAYAGGILALQGGETVTVPTSLRDGSTVEYTGSSSYTSLKLATTTYSNLMISGSGSWATSTALTITGNFTQTAGAFTQTGATTTFSGATSSTITTSAGTAFSNIRINKTATSTFLGSNLILSGNLELASGTLDATATGCSSASCNITLPGRWFNSGGTFTPRTGMVTLNGSAQSITGSNTFYNLTKITGSTDTLIFPASATQTIGGAWTAQGASGNLLSLRSSITNTQWNIDPQGTRTISYLDVKDSNNTNASGIVATGYNITNSLNNTNWLFNTDPDTPTSLGGASLVNGSVTTDTTPTLQFTQSDPDLSDQMRFVIQVDDSSDFSSPVVDYLSALAAQGATSFTVGQAPGGGSYTAGSSGQPLAAGVYYWRVLTSDNIATSSYATAGGGAVAFVVRTGGGGGSAPVVYSPATPYVPQPLSVLPLQMDWIAEATVEAPEVPPAPDEASPALVPESAPEPSAPIAQATSPAPQAPNASGSRGAPPSEIVVNGAGAIVASIVDTLRSNEFITGVGTLSLAPVTLAVQYSLAATGQLFGVQGLTDVRYSARSLLSGLMTLFGLRKRRRYWGTVYDSLTKQPLDPAIVELIDAQTGAVVEQSFTDLGGRFGFLDRPGRYTIRAQKTHYRFPSQIVTGPTDTIFENVYHGEVFEIRVAENVIAPNIPMDQLAYDWNQEEKKRMGVGKLHFQLDTVITMFLKLLFWGGFVAVLLVLVVTPSVLNGVFVLVYALLAWLERYLPKPRLWGRVTSARTDVNGLLIELRHASVPTVVIGKALTDASGKFFLKATPGTYSLEVLSVGPEGNTSLHRREVVIGKSMIVNDNIGI